jgi:hypothetical protein
MLTQRQAARVLQDPAGPALTRRLAHEVLAANPWLLWAPRLQPFALLASGAG